MKLINTTITDFIELVDSNNPTPGGGSSSALMSSLGLSLTRMVGHLTINKKNFLTLDNEVQILFKEKLESLQLIKEKIIPLIDEDAKSFDEIMKAYKLPKETIEEKDYRKEAIKKATLITIEIPYKVASLSLEAFNHFPFILKYGNKQTISDLGVGILALASGIEGALYNVMINLIDFNDNEIASHYKSEVHRMLKETNEFKINFLNTIYKELKL